MIPDLADGGTSAIMTSPVRQSIRGPALTASHPTALTAAPYLSSSGPLPHLFDVTHKPYRQLIFASEISLFDLRHYLFARQCLLLQTLRRTQEIAERACDFIRMMCDLAAAHVAAGNVPADAARAWLFTACMDIVESCTRKRTGAPGPAPLPQHPELGYGSSERGRISRGTSASGAYLAASIAAAGIGTGSGRSSPAGASAQSRMSPLPVGPSGGSPGTASSAVGTARTANASDAGPLENGTFVPADGSGAGPSSSQPDPASHPHSEAAASSAPTRAGQRRTALATHAEAEDEHLDEGEALHGNGRANTTAAVASDGQQQGDVYQRARSRDHDAESNSGAAVVSHAERGDRSDGDSDGLDEVSIGHPFRV